MKSLPSSTSLWRTSRWSRQLAALFVGGLFLWAPAAHASQVQTERFELPPIQACDHARCQSKALLVIESRGPNSNPSAMLRRTRRAQVQGTLPLEFAPLTVQRWPLTLGIVDRMYGDPMEGDPEFGPLRVFANPADV